MHEDLPKDILYTELAASTKVLCIPQENVMKFKNPVRKLSYHRQEILEDLGACASVIGSPAEDTKDDATQLDIKEWDSLGHLKLILELESQFSLSFEPEEIEEMTSLKEIEKVLAQSS